MKSDAKPKAARTIRVLLAPKTAAQISRECGVSTAMAYLWKAGTSLPALTRIPALADFLGMSEDNLAIVLLADRDARKAR